MTAVEDGFALLEKEHMRDLAAAITDQVTVHWARAGHGTPVAADERYVTCQDCASSTAFLLTVIVKTAVAGAGQWVRDTRACLRTPAVRRACGATCRLPNGFEWLCDRDEHPGTEPHNDVVYGTWWS